MKRFQTVLFDLDGTLVDSGGSIVRSLRVALDECGINYDNINLSAVVGPPMMQALANVLPNHAHDTLLLKKIVKVYREHYQDNCVIDCNVYAGIPQILERLVAQGFELAVATSKPEPFAEKILQHNELHTHFNHIVGSCLDLTRTAKSEVISHALSKLQQKNKNKMVMVGDRHHDIDGAKANQLLVIGVTYGYGPQSELAAADYIAHSPADLLTILMQPQLNLENIDG